MDTPELLALAVEAARRAGTLLLERFHAEATGVETKMSSTDLVSDADRDTERMLKDYIGSARPDDGYLGEEGARAGSATGITWIVDPLDGTVNYLYRRPEWSVSIAAADREGPLVGVVLDPNRAELFTAVRGEGAHLNGTRVQVSEQTDLAKALVGTGFSYEVDVRAIQAEVMTRVLRSVRDIRRPGSAALDLCSVACGRYDAYYESHMWAWDRAAGELIAREAGAVVTDLPPPNSDGTDVGVIAANLDLHAKLSAIVLG
jgi:myo-inositol-1(or 4)-monophosphatase